MAISGEGCLVGVGVSNHLTVCAREKMDDAAFMAKSTRATGAKLPLMYDAAIAPKMTACSMTWND